MHYFSNRAGASEQAAEQLLSVCNDSLEMAINMHMEGVDVGDASEQVSTEFSHVTKKSDKHTAPQQSYDSAGPSNVLTNTPEVDHDIAGNVSTLKIMIPFYSIILGEFTFFSSTQKSFLIILVIIDDDEEVRAPIPQKQETLIHAGYEGYPMNSRQQYRKARIRSVFDGFRNFRNEASGKY